MKRNLVLSVILATGSTAAYAQTSGSLPLNMSILDISLAVICVAALIAVLVTGRRQNKKLDKSLTKVRKELKTLKDNAKGYARTMQEMAKIEVAAAKQEVVTARQEVEKMLAETRQAYEKAEQHAKEAGNLKLKVEELTREIEQLKLQAIAPAEHIETLEERVAKMAGIISRKEPDIPMQAETGEELAKIVKEITETKKEKEYSADDWFLKGYYACENADYKSACGFYEAAAKKDLTHAAAYNNWGYVLDRLAFDDNDENLYRKAIEKYRKAIKIKPDYAIAYYNWGCVLSNMAEISNSASLFDEAIEKYREAIEINPRYAKAYGNWGYDLMLKAAINKSLKEDKEAIEESLTNASRLGDDFAAFNLTCLYSVLDEKDKAFEWLEIALIRDDMLTREDVETDRDFANIYNDQRFKNLLDQYRPIEIPEDEEIAGGESETGENIEYGEKIVE